MIIIIFMMANITQLNRYIVRDMNLRYLVNEEYSFGSTLTFLSSNVIKTGIFYGDDGIRMK